MKTTIRKEKVELTEPVKVLAGMLFRIDNRDRGEFLLLRAQEKAMGVERGELHSWPKDTILMYLRSYSVEVGDQYEYYYHDFLDPDGNVVTSVTYYTALPSWLLLLEAT